MSVTDIIKALREAAEESQSVNDVMDWVAGELIALDAKRQEAEKKSRWISVKDRLPEECTDVLLFCREGDASWITCGWRVDNRVGNEFYAGERYIVECVTHWMPLPEPPAPEGGASDG